MIKNLEINLGNSDNFSLPLIDGEYYSKENYFSILIGENSTHKSEILRSIAHESRQGRNKTYARIANIDLTPESSKFGDMKQRRCIAISATPFDKFPTTRSETVRISEKRFKKGALVDLEGYYYLGLRSSNSGIKRGPQRIFDIILAAVSSPRKRYSIDGMMACFKMLNLKPEAHFSFRCKAGDIETAINSGSKKLKRDEVDQLKKNIKKFSKNGTLPKVTEWITGKEFNFSVNFLLPDSLDDELFELMYTFGLLIKTGFFTIKDVLISKFENNSYPFSVKAASSGQLSLMLSLVGLSSLIEDGAIILIDEPELSLHPEWQLNFIETLRAVSRQAYGCHFILATHSPYIASSLPENNSTVTVIKKDDHGKVLCSPMKGGVSGWSVEQILTDVFRVRTSRNIEVESTVVNLSEMVSGVRPFNDSEFDADISRLKELNLKKDDPILEFINEIEELREDL